MQFHVGNDTGGHPRWWLYSGTNTVGVSGEAFDSLSNATRAAEGFKAGAKTWTYDIYADGAGKYRWRALALNNRNVGSSGQSFAGHNEAQQAAFNVRDGAGHADGP